MPQPPVIDRRRACGCFSTNDCIKVHGRHRLSNCISRSLVYSRKLASWESTVVLKFILESFVAALTFPVLHMFVNASANVAGLCTCVYAP